MKNDKIDALQKLRKIILKGDEKRIAELEKELGILQGRINDTSLWLEKLDPVLLDALSQKISESKEDVAETLAPVLGVAIKTQIQDAKEDMIDALYPVIGSTIRKSIAEAMKKLIKTINEKVDRALSFQLFFKKIKSKITGVSEGELVIKDSLPFLIHEIFLIHKKSGVLLGNVSQQGGSTTANQEIISGMLTAIRDFARTAFQKSGNRELNEIKYDDMQIYLEDGRYAYIAVVASDFIPDDFPDKLRGCEHQIHNRYHKELRAFDGNVQPLDGTSGILKPLLTEFSPQQETSADTKPDDKSSPKGLLYLLVIALMAAFIYLAFFWFPQQKIQNQILAHVEQIIKKNPTLAITNPTFDVDGRVVCMDGFVENENTKKRIEELIFAQPDVEAVENNLKMTLSRTDLYETLKEIENRLSDDLSVKLSELRYIVDGDILRIEGRVSSTKEKTLISYEISNRTALRMVVNNLSINEEPFRKRIENTTVHFELNNSEVSESEITKIKMVASLLKIYKFEKIYLHSYSDNSGSQNTNLSICEKRAELVKNRLMALGVNEAQVEIVAWGAKNPMATNKTSEGRNLNRRIEFILMP